MLGESPRWHAGRLYVSDLYAREVVALDLDGGRDHVVDVSGQPGGLGWLPDGDLLVVSMRDASVLRFDGRSTERVAALASPMANDMVVSASGQAYVGGMPDLYAHKPTAAEWPREPLYLVEPSDGGSSRTRVVADGLQLPNGAVMTPDGRSLIVAETMGRRLLAFDIRPDGTLTDRRVWADLAGMPDGICVDAEGCVWAAIPDPIRARGFWRIAEGGEIAGRYATERSAVAVELGGPEGDDLFMLEADVLTVDRMAELHTRGNSRATVGKVEVPAPPEARGVPESDAAGDGAR